MFKSATRIGGLLGAVVLVAWVPSKADAQAITAERPMNFSIEARAGIGVPTGDLSDSLVANQGVGPMFGLGVSYKVAPRIALRADGDVELLKGGDLPLGLTGQSSDLNLWHYNAGVEAQLLNTETTRWRLFANLGLGATTLHVKNTSGSDQTKFTANGGLKLGYQVTPVANLFVGGQAYGMFGHPLGDTAKSSVWSFPFFGGVRLTM